MAVGIALSGVAISLGAWAAGAAPDGGAVLAASLVGSSSWWKTTWHRTGVASEASALFFSTLAVVLGAVLDLNITMDGGGSKAP